MIDNIIPCYNSNLINTLGSILSQTIIDELEVTLVNDGGSSYSAIVKDFSKYIKIKEIGYSVNKGVGYARNYGLKNTNNALITFIDSDDTFNNSYALQVLKDDKLSIFKFLQLQNIFFISITFSVFNDEKLILFKL